jgi:hypothetical protein
MRFYDVSVNQDVPTETNRSLISYIDKVSFKLLSSFYSRNVCTTLIIAKN